MIETPLSRVTRIPLYTWCRAYEPRLGRSQSRLRGAGMEFDQLKEYQEGDRICSINWAATARRGGTPLVVNTYYEEKEWTVMLLVDLSASMDFGSVRLSKKALAAEVSASLIYSARVTHNRVGFLGFTSQADLYLFVTSLSVGDSGGHIAGLVNAGRGQYRGGGECARRPSPPPRSRLLDV
jgi:Mg-chelatase subunit ChlD